MALEVFDSGIVSGFDEYPHFGADVGGRLAGYVCVGRTPLTKTTWHLYWICVHPDSRRAGLGRALAAHAENFARDRGGRRLVLETSGRADYTPSRRFYEAFGFEPRGRIPDFYREGDDCLIYCKTI